MIHRKTIAKAAFLCLLAVVPAMADPSVLSLDYGHLSGSFTPGGANSGVFTARATTTGALSNGLYTVGYVSRQVPPPGIAMFNFSNGFDLADMVLSINVTNIDSVSGTAIGIGTLTATDINGDYIQADVTGQWTLINSQATFTGGTSNLSFHNVSEDSTFNGQFGTGFTTNFLDFSQMVGVATDITGIDGGLFATGFSGHDSHVTSQQVIPAPPTVLLGMLGLALAGWAKRRRMA